MFLICGEALFDILEFSGGERPTASVELRGVAGGSPMNVAIGLARLERSVALGTELYGDQLGRRLEGVLMQEGVDLSFVRRGPGPTPLAMVELDSKRVPHYAFHGVRGMRAYPKDTAWDDTRVTGVHIGSFPIVLEQTAENLLQLVMNRHDRFVSFDPNVRLAVEPDENRWHGQVERFRQHAHLVKVSVEDLQAINGRDCDVEKIAASWATGSTEVVVLTRGEAGASLFSRRHAPISVAALPSAVVDTVGAGDAFMAALLCWLDEHGAACGHSLEHLSRHQLRAMIEFAALASALTCSRSGPDLPRRSELVAEKGRGAHHGPRTRRIRTGE